MKVKLLKPLKTVERLIPRGEVVDLPKEQAESYLDRNLAVKPGVDIDEPVEEAAPATPPPQDDEDSGSGNAEEFTDKDGNALPKWPLKMTPIDYVDRHPATAPNHDLAKQYIAAGHGKVTATLD